MKILLTLVLVVITAPLHAMTVEFGTEELTVRNVSSGGAIAWNAVLVESFNNAVLRTPSRGVAVDEDGDGTISIRPERGVPQASVWAVVDLATGDSHVSSPLPELVTEFSLEPNFHLLTTPAVGRGWVTVLLARPGAGAWVREMTEGSPRDADGMSDARLTMNPESFELLVPGTGAPRGLRSGDVIIIFDWETLEYAVARIAR